MAKQKPLEQYIKNPLVVYCDGGKRGGIAYGSYKIYTNTGLLLYHDPFVLSHGSNNHAEYEAALRSLKAVRELYPHITVVDLRSDSDLVVCQTSGTWNCNKSHLQRMRDELIAVIAEFEYVDLHKIDNKLMKKVLGH